MAPPLTVPRQVGQSQPHSTFLLMKDEEFATLFSMKLPTPFQIVPNIQ